MKRTCKICHNPINEPGSLVHAVCRYNRKRELALCGMIPPDKWFTCQFCKQEYPFWNFLNNSCSRVTGSDCSTQIEKEQTKKAVQVACEKRKNKVKHSRPQECLRMPRCDDYVTCLGVEFGNYQKGCYKAPAPLKIDSRVFQIMAVK